MPRRAVHRRPFLAAGLGLIVLLGGMPSSASAMFTQLERVAKTSVSDSNDKSIAVSCPAGKRVIGAGGDVTEGSGSVLIEAIRPDPSLEFVTVRAREVAGGTTANWYAVAFAICAPAPAGLARVTATSVSNSKAKAVTATCPSGKRLLGTGGEIGAGNGEVLLDGIFPNNTLTALTVNALEDETGKSGNWTVTAHAICSNPVAGLEREGFTSPTESPGSRVTSVTCPDGKALISTSGLINSPNGQTVLDANFPNIGLTTASFAAWEDANGNSGTWSLTAYAICASQARRDWFPGPRDSGPGFIMGTACRPGEESLQPIAAITGALGQAWFSSSGHANFGGPSTRRDWYVIGTADEDGLTAPWAVDSGAVCATAIPQSERVFAGSADNSDETRSVTVPCPAGKRVLGVAANLGLEGHQVRLDVLRPDPTLTFVTAGASEDSTGYAEPWSIGVTVICAPAPPGLQRVASATAPASEELASTSAGCPAGKHLVGSGGEIVDGAGQVGFDDFKVDEALRTTQLLATEDEVGLATDWAVKAYAICVNR